MSEKRTPRDQWRFAQSLLEREDRADRAEVRRIAALSDEELAAELRAKGVDPQKAGEVGREAVEKFEREQGAAAAVPAPRVASLQRAREQREERKEREKRVGWPVLLVAAAVGVVVVGGIIAAAVLWRGGGDDIHPDTYDALPPRKPDADAALIAKAEGLRKSAFEHCAANEWEDCLVDFYEADKLDPDGANEKRALDAKERAGAELRKKYGDGGMDGGRDFKLGGHP